MKTSNIFNKVHNVKVREINNVIGIWNNIGYSFPFIRTVTPKKVKMIKHREPDIKWFTHWNQPLLDKVLDYK